MTPSIKLQEVLKETRQLYTDDKNGWVRAGVPGGWGWGRDIRMRECHIISCQNSNVGIVCAPPAAARQTGCAP